MYFNSPFSYKLSAHFYAFFHARFQLSDRKSENKSHYLNGGIPNEERKVTALSSLFA